MNSQSFWLIGAVIVVIVICMTHSKKSSMHITPTQHCIRFANGVARGCQYASDEKAKACYHLAGKIYDGCNTTGGSLLGRCIYGGPGNGGNC